MNLYQLRYFSVLAGTQHYGKAAEKLCIAQPSLSPVSYTHLDFIVPPKGCGLKYSVARFMGK